MFGWFMILSTAVMQKYGLFPNPDVPLQYKDWGAARTVEKGGSASVATTRAPPLGWCSLACGWRGPDPRNGVAAHGLGRARPGLAPAQVRGLGESGPRNLGRALVDEPAPLESPAPSLLPSPPPLVSAGALSQQGMGTFITNERAIIMIAHIHALTVSAAAAFGPQVTGGVGEGR